MLLYLIYINLAGLVALGCLPNNLNKTYRYLTLLCTNSILLCAIIFWFQFEGVVADQIFYDIYGFSYTWRGFNILFNFSVDGISLIFILLTTLILPFCVLSSWKIKNSKLLFINLLLIELLLILTFSSLDLFFFCIFFESLLIPMFCIVVFWGTRERRIKAITYFFLYTLFGSVFLILSIFFYIFELGTTHYFILGGNFLAPEKQTILWGLLFIVFAIKIPIFPFHLWLPEAHVEAPTVGSVILAALLLKLGGYGIVRFIVFFDWGRYYWQPLMITMSLISIFCASFAALRQVDIKRIIAYSSIAHINFALLGFFSNTIYGIVGGILLIVSHGLVSAALFLLVGVLYDRHHTRIIYYYGGLVQMIPIFSGYFFLFTVSNFSFPGTSNFIGELFIFFSLSISPHIGVLFLAGLSTFFGLAYSLFLLNRILFGTLNLQFIKTYIDLSRREFFILLPLAILNLLFGLCPQILITTFYSSIRFWIT